MNNKNLPYDRPSRVADELYELIVCALRTDITDPRLSDVYVTRVSMTKDLRTARVCYYFSDIQKADREKAEEGFKSARGFIKRLVGEKLSLKFMPEINFYYDEGEDTKNKIDSIFEQIGKK